MEPLSSQTVESSPWGEWTIPELVTFLLASTDVAPQKRSQIAQAFKAELMVTLTKDSRKRLIVARGMDNGSVVGTARMEFSNENAVVSDIVIRRDRRDSNVDTHLYEWVEAEAVKAGSKRLFLGPGALNGRAKRYFEAKGYRQIANVTVKLLS